MNNVACIDMEGVLIPELWPHIAKETGLSEFNLTTREEPNYEKLMQSRIASLRKHGLRLADLQQLLSAVQLLPGALAFVQQLRQNFEVKLVSDAFVQMIKPFWQNLGYPDLRCHELLCDEDGFVTQAQYSRMHGKHEVVEEFLGQSKWVLAVGDAYNDLSMLRKASLGFLYQPSEKTAADARDVYVAAHYVQITDACARVCP